MWLYINEPKGGPINKPIPIDAPIILMYFSFLSGKFIPIMLKLVAIANESPYP